MELQERVAVPIFTEVDRDVFLNEVYPGVSRNGSVQALLAAPANTRTVFSETPEFYKSQQKHLLEYWLTDLI